MLVTRQRLAFALAPVLPALYFLAVLYPTRSGDTGRNYVILMLPIAVSVSYLSCFLFGAPLISFLKRKQHLNTVYLSIGGAVLGAVVFYVFGIGFSALMDSSKSMVPGFSELMYGAALGILVALPFGLIAGYPFRGTVHDIE